MPTPRDKKLYERVKKKVYKDIPKHSAYRSGILVQKYKESYKRKYGSRSQPYIGKRKGSKLKRWFDEDWRNQDGKVGYHSKSDIYRPRKRVTSRTPTTYSELSKKEIKRARSKKYRTGRVARFGRISE